MLLGDAMGVVDDSGREDDATSSRIVTHVSRDLCSATRGNLGFSLVVQGMSQAYRGFQKVGFG